MSGKVEKKMTRGRVRRIGTWKNSVPEVEKGERIAAADYITAICIANIGEKKRGKRSKMGILINQTACLTLKATMKEILGNSTAKIEGGSRTVTTFRKGGPTCKSNCSMAWKGFGNGRIQVKKKCDS